MEQRGDWSGQQLAEFLAAVSSYGDEAAAIAGGVERVAEAVEAEVAALVRGSGVRFSVGFPRGRAPTPALCRIAAGGADAIDVPGSGPSPALRVPLEDEACSILVLGRSGASFEHEEVALVRAMARVLSLSLRMLRTLEAERAARERSERDAAQNTLLLGSLQHRQALLERLSTIQRSISHRAPIGEVLNAITEGAAELIGDGVVGLRLVDPVNPDLLQLVSSFGIDAETAGAIARSRRDEGLSGGVIASGELMVTQDYPSLPHPIRMLVDDDLRAAMGAPVFQDGRPIGCLLVASYDPDRRYEPIEQEMLLAFAEHASLALNDASAVDAMRKAFADAVHRAHHDVLTGLPNRALVVDRLDQALARASAAHRDIGVLFVDLDRFKVVNDTLGHSIGDEVLVCVGERLRAVVSRADTVGRLAGDEFVVVCESVNADDLLRIAERVAGAIEAPLPLYGRDAVITASIGIAHVPGGGRAEDVLRDADVAMYRAKERGRARIEVFDEAIRARLMERLETEHALRRGIPEGQLRLQYQPVVDTATGRLTGFEALVRWARPKRGIVRPEEFVSLAEDTGLIIPMGRWVLNEACRQLGEWRAAYPGRADLKAAVNLSPRQFADPGLVGDVTRSLAMAGLPGPALSLEITETILMEDPEPTARKLAELKELGVSLSIDDFGTGWSSLT
ncbi:MAG: putative bifunctional diguanylate cyclase/phosphodiesterase, partial [Acidimicrobiales bacterium]